jgi:hypothetical protein
MVTCERCGGDGFILHSRVGLTSATSPDYYEVACPVCEGSGKVDNESDNEPQMSPLGADLFALGAAMTSPTWEI